MTSIVSDSGWKITYENNFSKTLERIIKFENVPTEDEIRLILSSSECNERMHVRKLDKCIYAFHGSIILKPKRNATYAQT